MNPAEYNRELLARLDREEERIATESELDREDAAAEAFAKRTEKELRRDLGAALPADAVRVNLPANADPLAPRDPARRAQFERHLAAVVEGAVLDRDRLEAEPAAAGLPDDAREALSAGACAACRGSCCRAGGDHAYLTEETIARTMREHPDWTFARILELYLSYLPAESTLNSCIYHGPSGCGLPRSLRSPTCNTFLCGKLTRLRDRLPERQAPPVLAMMFDRGRWVRTALLDGKGVKILAED